MVQMFLLAFKRMERDWFMVDHVFYFLLVAMSSLSCTLPSFRWNYRPGFRKRGANVVSAPRLQVGLDGDTAGEDPRRLITLMQSVHKHRAQHGNPHF